MRVRILSVLPTTVLHLHLQLLPTALPFSVATILRIAAAVDTVPSTSALAVRPDHHQSKAIGSDDWRRLFGTSRSSSSAAPPATPHSQQQRNLGRAAFGAFHSARYSSSLALSPSSEPSLSVPSAAPTTAPARASDTALANMLKSDLNADASPKTASANDNASAATELPNWRVIPPQADSWDDHLKARPEWSDDEFQQALSLYNQFMECSDTYVAPAIKDALNCLDHAYRLYGPKSVVGSFNGGKDAVVILHLMRAAHANHYNSTLGPDGQRTVPITRPRVIYFDHPDEFPEVKDFLRKAVHDLDLDMLAFEQGTKFSQGLEIMVHNNFLENCGQTSWPISFVLGTRADDPNAAGQDQFAPSSHYMPPFMRVNPVLEWTYGHVWHFLRLFQLPYCILYDQGYTSLGTTKDTLPCPALLVPVETAPGPSAGNETNATAIEAAAAAGTNNLPKYWPAYMLGDWSLERAGRISKSSAAKTATKDKASNDAAAQKATGKPQAKKRDSSRPERSGSTASDFRNSDPKVMSLSKAEDSDDELQDGLMPLAGENSTNLARRGAEASSEPDWGQNLTAISSLYDDSTAFTMDSDADSVTQKSVGILIIGDEILKGLTMDQNTHAAAKALRAQNVLLSRVVVVSDTPEEIVEEIQRLQEEVDVIITSGGVGPTHDDVTIKSVASALGREMVFHKEMADLLGEKMNFGNKKNDGDNDSDNDDGSVDAADDNVVASADTTPNGGAGKPSADADEDMAELSEAHIKMATLPSNAKLRYLSDVENDWPVLQCRNIFILPGVPEFFAKKIENVAKYLSSQLERSIGYKVVLGIDEASIVHVLNGVVEQHPNVSFGSYPFVSHPEFQTVLTLEGNLIDDKPNMSPPLPTRNSTVFQRSAILSSKEQRDRYVQLALEDLIHRLPDGSILRVDNDDLTPFT